MYLYKFVQKYFPVAERFKHKASFLCPKCKKDINALLNNGITIYIECKYIYIYIKEEEK